MDYSNSIMWKKKYNVWIPIYGIYCVWSDDDVYFNYIDNDFSVFLGTAFVQGGFMGLLCAGAIIMSIG